MPLTHSFSPLASTSPTSALASSTPVTAAPPQRRCRSLAPACTRQLRGNQPSLNEQKETVHWDGDAGSLTEAAKIDWSYKYIIVPTLQYHQHRRTSPYLIIHETDVREDWPWSAVSHFRCFGADLTCVKLEDSWFTGRFTVELLFKSIFPIYIVKSKNYKYLKDNF